MKHIAMRLVTALLTCFLSCSEDKPTAPRGDDYDLVASETIGTAGGALEDEDFTLTVPPGAFDRDVELQLSVSIDHRPFGETQATYGYRLDNLPDEISQPLTLSIRYRRDLEGESFIAMGQTELVIDLDMEEILYDFVPAADSAGYLVGRLPAAKAGRPLKARSIFHNLTAPRGTGASSRYIHGVTDECISRSDHFELRYPRRLSNIRDELLDDLEACVDVCEILFLDEFEWQTVIDVQPFESAEQKYAVFSRDIPSDHMLLNQSHLTLAELPEVTREAGSEYVMQYLAHLWNYRYDERSHWLRSAIGLWAQEKLVTTTGHVPPRFRGCEMAPFDGIRAGCGSGDVESALRHGYGLSALIKYLVGEEFFGEEGLLQLHADLFAAQAVDGFHTSVGPSIDFYGCLPDLSARIYGIVLDDDDVEDEDKLRLAVSSPSVGQEDLMVLVFGYQNSEIEFLGAGSELILDDLKGLTEGGWDLLAVVVNSRCHMPYYLGHSDIYLSVDQVDASVTYDGWVSLLGAGDFRLQSPGEEDYYYTNELAWMFPPGGEKVYTAPLTGDNVFSDVMEYTFGENTAIKESIWVDLDHDLGRVEDFTVELWSESPSSRTHYLLSATDLPKVFENTRELEYAVCDEAVYRQISSLQYSRTDLITGAVTTLLRPVSGTGQYLHLGLRKPVSQGAETFDPSEE